MAQLLNQIPAHLANTRMFLDRLRTTNITEDCTMESFDVSALYTNVSNDSAMQAISEMLNEHAGNINLYGFSVHQLMTLLKACLNCNIFSWSSKHFAQIRGLAMGQRLAPTLAIAFMSRIEAPALQCRPLLYCRYIDDCFVICATQAEMDKCFELMNEQSEHIKLTRDTPQNDWLPFLNAQINIANSVCRTKWYRKPSNKNILVHFLSAHPAHAKKAIVTNMFRTATRVCSGFEEKEESLALAQRVAVMNGYTNQIPRSKRHKGVVRQSRDSKHSSFVIAMKRNSSFYITLVITPSFIINVLSIFGVFLRTADSMGKLGMALTNIMSVTFILGILATALPKTKELPKIAIYVMVNLCIMVFALTITLVLPYLDHFMTGGLRMKDDMTEKKRRKEDVIPKVTHITLFVLLEIANLINFIVLVV
ncbi:hypothetical protein Y032_0182g889 [Ancylostoma ceylanicum]|uniref:Reverse transcriptase domain-containing protein n=2 Tax=Ancylostoma ceylanicum TaxID=53326 RepID=A0A016SSP8_9BILA|nr:hypothetical protein Y032_0182g889 [Ancylostoma ceylanicum]